MKVAFLAPEFMPPWGGVGVYSVNLVMELSKNQDMEIHVITPKRDNFYEKDIEKIFDNRIKVHQISNADDTFIYSFKFQLALLKEFGKLHKTYNFDIVHSANLVHMPDIWLKFGKEKVPCLVTVHSTIKEQVKGFLKSNKNFLKMASSEKGSIIAYPIISLLEKIYVKRTKNIVTVSNKYANKLREVYKRDADVVHNGILMDIFDYEKIKNPLSEFPELERITCPLVLYAGRIITGKGIEVFVKSMKKLQNEKVHFVIAGKGDTKWLEKLFETYEIKKEKYTFLGFVDNHKLPSLYKLSSIFVLPSFSENFPISLLEAMSMKCCCISTDVGAVDEIIDDKINGIIINQGDSEELAEKIRYLLENEQDREKMAQNGYQKAKFSFNSKIMAEKTKEIYERIVKK